MANFRPLNNYSLILLDKFINDYKLKSPFLDVACGNGYVSKHLAQKGWKGTAIDYSKEAIENAKNNLKIYKNVTVKKQPLSKASGKYNTIVMFDVLEHIENDLSALRKINTLLNKDGYLIIAGPSNPHEWRWDDNFYGHFRRYSENDLIKKLSKANFTHLRSYDYTYPFFWGLRRLYTKIIPQKSENKISKEEQTKKSSLSFAWNIPLIGEILNKTDLLWYPLYLIQYIFFKDKVELGSSMIIIAKK